MTVASETSRVQYAGNDVSVTFSVPFPFIADADLKVYIDDTLQVITTGYTVSGAGGASGSVTFLSAPATGETVTIYRDPAVTQETDYVANDSFPAEAHERALDLLTMIASRLKDRLSRVFRFADTSTTTVDPVVPDPEANKFLGWDDTASALRNYSASEIAVVSALGTFVYDVFSGTGEQTAFTLSANPGAKTNTFVYVGGVYQQKSTYSISGTTLTFSVAPTAGSSNIEVQQMRIVDGEIGTPADGSVGTDSLAAGLLVPVSKGGTGKTSWTANTLLLGNGTGVPVELSFGSARRVAISDGSAWTSRALVRADLPDLTDVAKVAVQVAIDGTSLFAASVVAFPNSTTCRLTIGTHFLAAGDVIYVDFPGTGTRPADGQYTITAVAATTIDFTVASGTYDTTNAAAHKIMSFAAMSSNIGVTSCTLTAATVQIGFAAFSSTNYTVLGPSPETISAKTSSTLAVNATAAIQLIGTLA